MKFWPFKKKEEILGTLRIDKSDPYDGPYIFLELEVDPSILEKKEYVTLRVNTKSYVSQK